MIVWRNHAIDEYGASAGYRFFATKAAAIRDCKDNAAFYADGRAEVARQLYCGNRRADLVKFLNDVASHPDNG